MIKYIVLTLLLLTLTYSSVNAEQPKISNECKQKMEERYEEFTNKVFEDVLNTYKHLNKQVNQNNVIYFTSSDLFEVKILLGRENAQLHSLDNFFEGVHQGERRLYFFNGEPNRAYILYKNTSNQNVMIILKRTENKWVEIERSVKKGKEIEFVDAECENDN